MARVFRLILSFTAVVAVNAATDYPWTDLGMRMSDIAFQNVCWYENLKQLHPATKGQTKFLHCTHQVTSTINQLEPQTKQPGFNEAYLQKYFGQFVEPLLSKLTPSFKQSCGKYLKDAKMKPASDESDVLDDTNKDSDYPFKGFAYCLMSTLRKTYGQEAIDAVKENHEHPKHWATALNDRDNEYRARHHVGPLTLDAKLMKDAQDWADKLAAKCENGYPHSTDSERQYNGKTQGESVYRAGANDDKPPHEEADMALSASNAWYSEVDYYDYDTGKSKQPPKAVGHFTATVWKGTDRVGYGYAYNPKCTGPNRVFIVARYFPGGNVSFNGKSLHKENVLRP